MSTILANKRRLCALISILVLFAVATVAVQAQRKKTDPLIAEVATLISEVDEILLDPAFKAGALESQKKDRTLQLYRLNGYQVSTNPEYERLITLVKNAKTSIEKQLPTKGPDVIEPVVQQYLILQNRLYANYFANIHQTHRSKLASGIDFYEDLNLRVPVSVGDAIMIGRKPIFENNIWHVESKKGSGVFDLVEFGPSPLEKAIDEDSAFLANMSYQNYAKTVVSQTLFQRVTNLWSVARMDSQYQDTKVDFRGCGYHSISQRYSSKSHFSSYYDYLFRTDLYGDLVHSADSHEIYSTLFAPVTTNPILDPSQVGDLVKKYFLMQESFLRKTDGQDFDPHWITLWNKIVPTNFTKARGDYWAGKMDEAFKTSNYPMDDWSEEGISTRISEIAYHAEKELLASILVKYAENEKNFISEFNPSAELFYIKPEVSKARALKLVEDALEPLKEKWLSEVKSGIKNATHSDLIKKVRAGKAELRFSETYDELKEILEIAARAHRIKDITYNTYNSQKLNWEDQKILLKVNYSTTGTSVGRFLKDQWQKEVFFDKTRSERKNFERSNVDETLRMKVYDLRNDQLSMVPASLIGSERLAPADPSDLKSLFELKLSAFADSEKQSSLKSLAKGIREDKVALTYIEDFFKTINTDYIDMVIALSKKSGKPVEITEKNSPLYLVLYKNLKGLMAKFDKDHPLSEAIKKLRRTRKNNSENRWWQYKTTPTSHEDPFPF